MITKNNISGLDNELNFRCYEFNRRRSPDIPAREWADYFPNWQKHEERMIVDHISRNKIEFPSVLMAAHYIDNWKPAEYDLGNTCSYCKDAEGSRLIEGQDGGTDLYCDDCVGYFTDYISGRL